MENYILDFYNFLCVYLKVFCCIWICVGICYLENFVGIRS